LGLSPKTKFWLGAGHLNIDEFTSLTNKSHSWAKLSKIEKSLVYQAAFGY